MLQARCKKPDTKGHTGNTGFHLDEVLDKGKTKRGGQGLEVGEGSFRCGQLYSLSGWRRGTPSYTDLPKLI